MVNKISQKDAVFRAIELVLLRDGIWIESTTKVSDLLTPEHKVQITNILSEGFKEGLINLKSKKTNEDLDKYVIKLQSNWLTRDRRLNGNVMYMARNTDLRNEHTDPQIKALKALLSTKTDEKEIEEIQGYISQRLEALKSLGVFK